MPQQQTRKEVKTDVKAQRGAEHRAAHPLLHPEEGEVAKTGGTAAAEDEDGWGQYRSQAVLPVPEVSEREDQQLRE